MKAPLLLAFGSVLASVGAQFLLSAGVRTKGVSESPTLSGLAEMLREPLVLAGLALYVGSAAAWLFVLQVMEVSKAYPLVGAGFLVSVAIGAVMGEAVSTQRILGAMAIFIGVALVATS